MESQIIEWILNQGPVVALLCAIVYFGSKKLEKLENKNDALNNRLLEVYGNSMIELTVSLEKNTEVLSKVQERLDAGSHE